MFQLGKSQELMILRVTPHGAFLGERESEDAVLLPGQEIPAGAKVGDRVTVFIYRDSEDRLIATVRTPKITLGAPAVLTVKNVTGIGAFLDWGLEKDLFLPFKEQNGRPAAGMQIPVALYVDKSDRLCATMHIDKYLSANSPYRKDDRVTGIVYGVNPRFGAFVAVDMRYYGLIQQKDIAEPLKVGDGVEARITQVREDGKLNLKPGKKAYKQLEEDADSVLSLIEMEGGSLPFTDKAAPELIKEETGLTKNAFKRAVGHLLKEGKIEITDSSIRMR